MKTTKPDNVSLLEQRLADRIEPWRPTLLQKITAGVAVAALYVMTVFGAGCDGNGPNPNVINPIPPSYSVTANITPADGAGVGPDDDPLSVSLRTPALNPECAADPDCNELAAGDGVEVTVTATYDNATPSDSSDDETVTVASETGAAWDTTVTGNITMSNAHGGAGLADGERITLEATLTATDTDGVAHTGNGSVEYVFEGEVTDRAVVDSCYVQKSNVGTALAMQCNAHDPLGRDLIGTWTLTTDLEGAIIADLSATASQIAAPALGVEDVGLHTYTVAVLDSAEYAFTVPVDEHYSTLTLHCSDGTNHDLLLPETSVDAVAEECGTGFNAALKPAALGQPDYVLDVNAACVPTAIISLSAAEREAHEHYNNGTTVSDISCALDFAQVRYRHD